MLTSSGCGLLSYNSGWNLFKRDLTQSKAYQDMLEKRRLARAQRQQQPAQRASFEDQQQARAQRTEPYPQAAGPKPATQARQAPQARTSHTDAPASPEPVQLVDASHHRRSTMSSLGLYGQLPHRVPRLDSPLDSPEGLRRVTHSTLDGEDADPAIDPSGQFIAFASTRHRNKPDIYLKRIGGSATQQITHDQASDRMPAFSPDGKWLAFASDRAGNWDIYIKPLDGGQPRPLTQDASDEICPSFSPDGKQLVYASYGSRSGQWELVVIDVDNPTKKQYIGYGLLPDWSPVDNRIVYQRAREKGTRWFSIWTIELVNGQPVRPTEIAASYNAGAITPKWNPDGTRVVFSTVINPDSVDQTRPVQADVWVVNADGSGRVNLTNNRYANKQPVWSPKGGVFFVTNRSGDGAEAIWSLDPARSLDHMGQPVRNAAYPGGAASPGPAQAASNPGTANPPAADQADSANTNPNAAQADPAQASVDPASDQDVMPAIQ